METRPRTPTSSLTPDIVRQMNADITSIQTYANALVEVMTDGFKNRFHVDLTDLMKLTFDPDTTKPVELSQFLEAVDHYQAEIERIADGEIDSKDRSNNEVFEKAMQDEASSLKEQSIFQAMKEAEQRIEKSCQPWIDFKISLASALQREKDMEPVKALQSGILALKTKTEGRVNGKKADPLRSLEVAHLCDQVQAIIENPLQSSPKQLLTDCCREVEISIQNIKSSTYGYYSITAQQLESLLAAAKAKTIKNADSETEMEVGDVSDMLGTIRYLLSSKFDTFWVERNKPRGITEMKAMLSTKEIQEEVLWKQIKEKASERLNTKTLLGYPIDRSKDVAEFYFQITKTHLNGLKELQRRFEACVSQPSPTPT